MLFYGKKVTMTEKKEGVVEVAIERRYVNIPLEVRAAEDGKEESRTIRGYAAVFNTDNSQLDQEGRGFTERLDPHCFDGVINKSDVCALYEHDYATGILARCTNGKGTMKLSIDKKGLLCEFDLPNTTLGDNVLESVKRGDLRGMSFSFTTKADEWSHDDNDNYTRTIKEVDKLFDVSLVAMPAYDKTSVDLRSVALTNDPKPEPKKAEACEEYFMRKRDEIFG